VRELLQELRRVRDELASAHGSERPDAPAVREALAHLERLLRELARWAEAGGPVDCSLSPSARSPDGDA
jgi:hypothetical protein